MRRAILIAMALCCLSQQARAFRAFIGGNELYEWCKVRQSTPICDTYVLGVLDARINDRIFCLSEGVDSRELTDLVTVFLSEHPDERRHTAASLVLLALKEKFPCN
jgi:hypothetical protein